MPKPTDTLTAPPHGRTPDNTPIPGGGSWTWDAASGSWAEVLPTTVPARAAEQE